MNLEFFPGSYSIYRLPADSPSTQDADSTTNALGLLRDLMSLATQCDPRAFFSLSATPDEFSIVGPSSLREGIESLIFSDLDLISNLQIESDFFCFRVAEQLAFDAIGIIAAISQVFADHKIPILSVSTFDTDYFLAHQSNRAQAIAALRTDGYSISE